MIDKEEIKKKLQEDPDWTLPDDASDEDWDIYFEAKDEMVGDGFSEEDSWEDEEEI
ncbi:hypothetical protein K0B04_03285 [Patescibacteria group bacterium]|nr:hypothetical protein [Patescibacteria group bacterium]